MATMHNQPVPSVEEVVFEPEVVRSSAARKALAALRIAFGLTFLWAFFDKLLALGFHTGVSTNPDTGAETLDRFGPAAWINGGSPTQGFLKFGVSEENPFHGFYNSIGGTVFADWLFMIGLLGIGLALTLGFGMRIAAATGALLYFLMWTASLPLENNPVIDDHILGMISVIVLGLTLAGDTWGVGKAWAKTHLVRAYPFLR
jgi:thiosulfate dehydrogenase [quinone] large subunit